MSDMSESVIMAAISYDIGLYEYRCKKYNEEVQYTRDHYGNLIVDCYGEHADKLRNLDKNSLTNKQ